MYFKKITGTLCYLSPIDCGDAEQFTQWLNDLAITENLSMYHTMLTVEVERMLLAELSKQHNYSIIETRTNSLIGNCGFAAIDHLNQTAEAGIFIGDKNYRGKGYGTEALRLLLGYGFLALNLHSVYLRVYSFNQRALRSYEKIGFKMTGKWREALRRGPKTYDILLMDILDSEFYAENPDFSLGMEKPDFTLGT